MLALRRSLLSVFFGLAVACGTPADDDVDAPGEGSADASAGDATISDAGDAGDPGDAATDLGRDDARQDATPDAATDTGSDGADADADTTPDAPADASDAAAPDGSGDTGIPLERCGDGVVDPGEECDDGNRIDTDLCTSTCQEARCGDGFRNETIGTEVFTSPLVVNPGGIEGFVCDDGATCPGGDCDVENEPTATEHGICQALGYERALNVSWGGGLGDGASTMLHAYNWTCFDYLCVASDDTNTQGDCASWEMLASIACEGLVGEACDDGEANGPTPDACRSDCTLPFCGDGITDRGEQCDDANDVDDDGCRSDCTLPYCGDGRLNEGEQCDDGNDDDLDACRNDCVEPFCGDGVVSAYPRTEIFTSPVVTNPFGATGHVCDNGASCPGRACDLTASPAAPEHGICQSLGFERATFASWGGGSGADDPVMPKASNWACADYECGPGPDDNTDDICGTSEMLLTLICSTSRGEQCDDGEGNSDEVGADCRTTCQLPACGDGVVEGDEQCDDGNRNNDDLCTNRCELPRCGDGIRQGDEACDDGNLDDLDGCRNDCTPPVCGDGVRSEGETCDLGDANSDEPDAPCRSDCTVSRCGDGVLDTGEECDDGGADEAGVCTPACQYGRCGDGIRQNVLGEQCDDGNRLDGDGCDRVCLREVGNTQGFISYVGHDFFSTNPDVSTLLGNAVFGEQGGAVRVVAYDQFADRGASGEVANVDRVLDEQAANRGLEWERVGLGDWRELDDALAAADVLLVYEQESGGGQMATIGAAWGPSLLSFAAGGGRVVIMDYSGSSWRLLTESAIVEATGARTIGSSAALQVADSDHPLLAGVELPYTSSNGTIAMQLTGDSLDFSLVYNVVPEAAVVVYVPF